MWIEVSSKGTHPAEGKKAVMLHREPVLNEAGNLWKPKYVSHLPINFKYFGLT
jgi:hypothetical protein